MFTPWGVPKRLVRLEPGITFAVATRGSGLMLSRGYAERHLTVSARCLAIRFGEYYTYSVEQAWTMPVLELPHLWAGFATASGIEMGPDPSEFLRTALASQAQRNAEKIA